MATRDLIDELRRLNSAATKPPWVLWCGEGPDHKGVEKYSVCHYLPLPIGAPDYGNCGSHACVATAFGKYDEQAAANAALIAACRNVLPALLTRLEALERVAEAGRTVLATDHLATRSKLLNALRALDAAEAEEGKERGGG